MSRIELRQIHKRYGEVAVLHDINLTIEDGEFCVFIGPSGCGKSTLLRLIAGLEEISRGELLIDGRRVNDLPPAQRDVAMVFQSYALYPHMSVHENMAFGLRHQPGRKLPAAEIERRVQAAARSLQLEALLDRRPKALSGGQRQRVAIGRAIVRQPRVFLFDEPLSNLDAALRIQTRVEIAKLHRELGSASMVYVTHDQVEAMTLADKIVLLRPDTARQGQPSVAQVGSPLALYHHPRNRFVAGFIGSPAMNFLEARVVEAGPRRVRVGLLGGGEASAEVMGEGLAAGELVSIGIRPEHLALGRGPGRGTVMHLEHLGETTQAYLQVPGHQGLLLAKNGFEDLRLGDTVPFEIPPSQAHLFRADGSALARVAA
jgi:multiple sugar transport system ATP-binding protein